MAKKNYTISVNFSDNDLNTLLDGLDALDKDNSNIPEKIEFFLKFIPDECSCGDESHHEGLQKMKSHLMQQEGQLRKEKKLRREKLTLLKASIIRAQQDYAVEHLGDADDDE